MTVYRSCVGCVSARGQCDARDELRSQLKGLGITSVKWKCRNRVPMFQTGDLVWIETVADQNDLDDDGNPYRGEFPAVVVGDLGSRALVFVEEGASERHDDSVRFAPTSNGFCKIPLSRMSAREGEREEICTSCNWPTSKGHRAGYICERVDMREIQ